MIRSYAGYEKYESAILDKVMMHCFFTQSAPDLGFVLGSPVYSIGFNELIDLKFIKMRLYYSVRWALRCQSIKQS